MSVPVENLYYLLCYAWNHLDAARLVDVGAVAGRSPEELLARMLGDAVAALLKRGLDRSYVDERDDLRGPRGKLDLNGSLKRNLLRQQRVACDFDEFQPDVLHNRLIKSTLLRLTRVSSLPSDRRVWLRDLGQRMVGVAETAVRPQDFGRVRLHRSNRHYAFALAVSELLHRHLLPAQFAGEWRLNDFRGSDQEMGHLFEAFVRTFVRREMPDVGVLSTKSYAWQVDAVDGSPTELVPALVTDVPLRLGDRRLIVECKFTARPLATNRFGKRKLRSAHLNQIFAYLSNVGVDWDPPGAGLILYAAVDQTLDLHYRFCGRDVFVQTLDLAQPWEQIHAGLDGLIRNVFGRLTAPPTGWHTARSRSVALS